MRLTHFLQKVSSCSCSCSCPPHPQISRDCSRRHAHISTAFSRLSLPFWGFMAHAVLFLLLSRLRSVGCALCMLARVCAKCVTCCVCVCVCVGRVWISYRSAGRSEASFGFTPSARATHLISLCTSYLLTHAHHCPRCLLSSLCFSRVVGIKHMPECAPLSY